MKTKAEIAAMKFVRDGCAADPNAPHLGGNHIGNMTTFWHDLGYWIMEKYRPAFVLDVGCGEGRALSFFNTYPYTHAIGIDGLPWNAHTCKWPVLIHDFCNGPVLFLNINLVWCVEVVEHIEEKYIHNLLETLANGDVICMTHGLPGQGGYHHVNCQPAEYWINHLGDYGYVLDKPATDASKIYTPADSHWGNSGMIFTKK